MNNLYLSFSVVLPLFCMMALGTFLRYTGLFNEEFLKRLNTVCFKVFLPLTLFMNIYNSDFYSLFSWKLILFALACVGAAFIVLMISVPLLVKDQKSRGVVIQGIFRSNFILFGVPIASSLYGSGNTGTTAILLSFVIPVFNLLSVIALETFSGRKSTKTALLKEIAKNPLILGSLLAFLFVLTGVKLPEMIEGTISQIAAAATPLALIVLGGSNRFQNISKYKKMLTVSVIGKLLIMPAVFLPVSIYMGFRGMELAALMAMFSSPTAVSSFTMAQNANANHELAGQIVVIDSALSIFTIFLIISLLKMMNLI